MKRVLISLFILPVVFSCASNPKPAQPSSQEAAVEQAQETVVIESDSSNEEYKRSVSEIAISVEQFELDKRIIMAKINELDAIMEARDFRHWVSYLDNDSVEYWSKKGNLQKASRRLPIRGMKLNSLEDYFKFVFIPARVGKRVDEIRYETESQIKAVQVNDESDTIYYNFKKISGEWKVNLPPLEE